MKKINLANLILVFLTLLILTLNAQSQFMLNTSIHSAFDDNVNNNYLNTYDMFTQFSLQSAYDIEGESKNLQIFYIGSYNYYRNVIARSFHIHSTGLVFTKLFGKESETTLNIGGNFNLRRGREMFTYFDNNQYIAYINIKQPLSERAFGKLGYRVRYLAYNELNELNNLENYFFAQMLNFFASKTTLALETNLGIKTYTNAPPETISTSAGMGKGKYIIDDSNPSVIQLAGNIRIAQSIFDKTGLSLAFGYQRNLQQETRYLPSGYIISDDDLFDDNYGYEGPGFEATLTQILPWSMMGKVSFNYLHKKYVNRPAYDLLDSIKADVRVDKVSYLSVIIEKEFFWLNGLTVSLMYDFIRNTSNDEFYNYKNNVWAISFDLGF